jgi:hypothetical protein
VSDPVFIVGVPRSGTTLLAASLAAHGRISCGPETHFFRRLAQADEAALVDAASWPETAVSFISGIKHAGFKGHESKFLLEKYGIERPEIAAYLQEREPGVTAVLAAVTETHMKRMGKVRWAEKTPDHLLHTELIRCYFPNAPIIRIVRDPRDAALSLTRVPWGAASFAEALLFWRKWDAASYPFFETDGRSHTIRFEDFVTRPQAELEKICAFIGEPFEPGMLDTARTSRTVNSRNVPWKRKVGGPFDPSRTEVWRRELDDADNRLAEAFLGDRMAAYGYPVLGRYPHWGALFPADDLALKAVDGLKRVAAEGVRFWPAAGEERPSVVVYLGDPAVDNWFGAGGRSKAAGAFAVSANLLRAKFSGQKVYWIPERGGEQWSGYLSSGVKRLLAGRKVVGSAAPGKGQNVPE